MRAAGNPRAARRACSGRHPPTRRAGDNVPASADHPRCGRPSCATDRSTWRPRAPVAQRSRRHPRVSAAPVRPRRRVPDRRTVLCAAAGTYSRNGAAPSRPLDGRSKPSSRARQATRVALVHGDVSPKNILSSDQGPVAARRRVCVVGRSGLRQHRVLPQPPAAQGAFVEPGRRQACWSPYRRLATTTPGGRRLGAARRSRRAASLLPGLMLARGRQVAGRVPDGRGAARVVRRVARALLRTPPATWRRSAPPAQALPA